MDVFLTLGYLLLKLWHFTLQERVVRWCHNCDVLHRFGLPLLLRLLANGRFLDTIIANFEQGDAWVLKVAFVLIFSTLSILLVLSCIFSVLDGQDLSYHTLSQDLQVLILVRSLEQTFKIGVALGERELKIDDLLDVVEVIHAESCQRRCVTLKLSLLIGCVGVVDFYSILSLLLRIGIIVHSRGHAVNRHFSAVFCPLYPLLLLLRLERFHRQTFSHVGRRCHTLIKSLT